MPSVIDDPKIKDKCQTFTPIEIINQMLDIAGYCKNVYGKRVLENSCGDGEILSLIVNRYICDAKKKKYSREKIKIGLEQDIVAYDIDQELVNICKSKLDNIALKYKIKDVQWNVQCADYMTVGIEGNFEYIIGNPPYIAYPDLPQEIQSYLKENYVSCKKGKFDYSYAFIEKSYNILADKGCLVYIIPSNIFKNVFAEEVRNLIKDDLNEIIDFTNECVFKDVLVSPAIIKVIKGSNIGEFSYTDITNAVTLKKMISKKTLSKKWIFDNNVKSDGIRIGDHFKVSSSIATLCNDAFVLRGGSIDDGYYCIGNNRIEMSLLKKAWSPKNKKYKKYDEYIIFPYYYLNGQLNRYSEDDMMNNFPQAMEYLLDFKERLESRDSDKSAKWFEFGRSQALQHIHQEKILISSIISDCTKAYLLEMDEIPYSGLYIIPTGRVLLEDLLEELNTDAFKSYVLEVGVCVSGTSRRITPRDIENYIY